MDLSTISFWCWLIPLVVGLLCAYLGYLIGKGSRSPEIDSPEVERLEKENEKLAADLAACREQTGVITEGASLTSDSGDAGIQSDGQNGDASVSGDEVAFDPSAAKASLGKNVKHNDLKLIEGIGPKIENLFHNHDIDTWLKLADLNVAQCRDILMTGGERYRLHDPASWPMQARMAAEGKWKDLARWQDDHKHGKL